MIESKIERDMSLLMKTIRISYNGELMTGQDAMSKLVIADMLGHDYVIDWNATPATIMTNTLNIL